jgi:hypothetical protein
MEATRDRWEEILYVLAPELHEALNKYQSSAPHVSCPVHGGSDGFRLFKDANGSGGGVCNSCGFFSDGFKLLTWIYRSRTPGGVPIDYNATKDSENRLKSRADVGKYLEHGSALYPSIINRIPKREPSDNKAEQEKKWQFALKIGEEIWSKGEPFHPIVAQYFRDRGQIDANLPQILYLCMKVLYSGPIVSYHPAMIAPLMRIVPNPNIPGEFMDEVVGIHRTYLRQDNDGSVKKAFVVNQKRELLWNTRNHSFIPLYPRDGDTLVVCEGIETGVAVHTLTNLPVWAAGNARELSRMFIPSEIKHVIIAGDHDRSGTGSKAVKALKEKLEKEGFAITVMIPSSFVIPDHAKSVDWEDVIVKYRDQAEALWQPFSRVDEPEHI